MMIFLKEYLWVLFFLVGFSLAGGFAILPFRENIKYSLFAMPLAGLLMVVLGSSAIYSIVGMSFLSAVAISYGLCILMTTMTLIAMPRSALCPPFKLILFSAFLVAFIVYITNYTSIVLHGPGFLLMDGTDHLGYAHLADWINNHVVIQRPLASALLPYQSWPEHMFSYEPRFGSCFTLALIAGVRGLSAMFAYDPACAIVLVVGILGVAAVFARSSFTFVLLTFGLLTTAWFEYSCGGYFGKILGYPANLFCLGLFLISHRPFKAVNITVLAALTCSAAAMHFGLATAMVFVLIGGGFIIFTGLAYIKENKKDFLLKIKDDFAILMLLIGVAIVTTGAIAKPTILGGAPPMEMSWETLWPRLLDLEANGPFFSNFTSTELLAAFFFIAVIALANLIVGFIKKETLTLSLIVGPSIFLMVLLYKNQNWVAFQLIGAFYPWLLSASICLIDTVARQKRTKYSFLYLSLVILLLINIGLHIPRLMGGGHHYAGEGVTKTLQFSQEELDELADIIKNDKAVMNIDDSYYALALLVELGRRNIEFQYTPETWKRLFGYRDWQAPKVDPAALHWIELNSLPPKKGCLLKFKTRQYNLFTCSP